MSELRSKCCGAETMPKVKYLDHESDYERTKDGWILVRHICIKCNKLCEVEEKKQEEENEQNEQFLDEGPSMSEEGDK